MTDLETMLAMLERAKIKFERQTIDKTENFGGGVNETVERQPGFVVLTVERGYHRFVSDLIFDRAGVLVSIEAYE